MAGTIKPYDTAKGRRWRVRYPKSDGTWTDKRGFKTRRDGELYLATITTTKASGDYIDPARAKVTIDSLAPTWLDSKRILKPSAYAQLTPAYRNHVKPTWGSREIGTIRPSEVQAWVTGLTVPKPGATKGKSASVALRALGVLAGILDSAVDDKLLNRNPARGLKNLPKKPKKKPGRIYLTHDQLHTLAEASARPEMVLTLGYTGIRWGEAAGLRVRNLNMLRRRLHIEENAVQVDGKIEVGTPKSHEQRSVPFPSFLAPLLANACTNKGPNDLVFGNGKDHLKPPRFGDGWFDGAISRVQETDEHFPRVTPHDLRHTAASLAVAAGANVKALQRMLGHASAAMTLDTYADLFDDDLDAVAERLEERARAESLGKNWAKVVQQK